MERRENRLSRAMNDEPGIIEDIGESGQKSVQVVGGVQLSSGIHFCRSIEDSLQISGSYPADVLRMVGIKMGNPLVPLRRNYCKTVGWPLGHHNHEIRIPLKSKTIQDSSILKR